MITTNSLGQRIAKTDEQIAAFWRWFGKSKVVDEQGRPLVVYHGTNADFDRFDLSRGAIHGHALGPGAYFTNNHGLAESYGGQVIHAYLALNNPTFSIKRKTVKRAQVEHILRDMESITPDVLSNYGDVRYDGRSRVLAAALEDVFFSCLNDAEVLSALINIGGVPREAVMSSVVRVTGKDGFVHGAEIAGLGVERGDKVFTALLPTCIKSATANRGTFDPKDPVITNPRRRNPPAIPAAGDLDWHGSEKQIAWAKTIRSRKLPQITGEHDRVRGEYLTFVHTPRSDNGLYRAAHENAKLTAQRQLLFITHVAPFIADARWWIDVRDRQVSEIVYIYGQGIGRTHIDTRHIT